MTTTQTAKCTRCQLSNCPGPDQCLVDCLTCDDGGHTTCPAPNCDQGHTVEADGERRTKCPLCKGKGRVTCPDC